MKEEEVAGEIEQADTYMEDIYDAIAKLEQLYLQDFHNTHCCFHLWTTADQRLHKW